MGVGFSLQRVDEAHVVCQVAELRNQAGDHLPAIPAGREFPRTFGQVALFRLEGAKVGASGHGLTVTLDQLGFVVEGVVLAAGARTEDDQHLVGLGLAGDVDGGLRVFWED